MEARTKNILIGLSVVAVGTGGYLLYRKYASKQEGNPNEEIDQLVNSYAPTSSYSPSQTPTKSPKSPNQNGTSSSLFPLKNKSKGVLVKDVQEALIQKFGKEILPKYGADGFFGKELETALVRKGYVVPVSKAEYEKLVKKQVSNHTDRDTAKEIAEMLKQGILKRNIEKALQGLFKIKNVLTYAKVNEVFKQIRINGVRMTLPTALSSAFPMEKERTKYRAQLYRIGLKYRNDKWALAGLPLRRKVELITTKRTKVFEASGQFHWVAINTRLGYFKASKKELTEFYSSDGKSHFVPSSAIRFIYD